jgi:hypothetical protein
MVFKILVLTSQKIQCLTIIKPNKLILYGKVTIVNLRAIQIAKFHSVVKCISFKVCGHSS